MAYMIKGTLSPCKGIQASLPEAAVMKVCQSIGASPLRCGHVTGAPAVAERGMCIKVYKLRTKCACMYTYINRWAYFQIYMYVHVYVCIV